MRRRSQRRSSWGMAWVAGSIAARRFRRSRGLPALVGAWREAGGGLQLSASQAFQLNRAALEMPHLQAKPTRVINMSELGSVLTEVNDPPVKALVVYNSNPAAVAPNLNRVRRGLAREDLFTVVLDHLQTDTADYADILLPATTFLEHTDLYTAWGHHYLQLARGRWWRLRVRRSRMSRYFAHWRDGWDSMTRVSGFGR